MSNRVVSKDSDAVTENDRGINFRGPRRVSSLFISESLYLLKLRGCTGEQCYSYYTSFVSIFKGVTKIKQVEKKYRKSKESR